MRHSIRSCGALGFGFFFVSVVWAATPLSGRVAQAATEPAEAAAKIDQLIVGEMSSTPAETKPAAKKAAKPAGAYPTGDSSASTALKPHASAGPTRLSDDETFLRRATMDLVGHPPTPKDITAFALDPSPEKRVKAIDRLLASSDFGENWGRYWRDVIMYRKADDRAMLVAPAIESYLAEEFNKDTPWDKIARSFITADGDIRENGSTGIIFAQAAQAVDVTAEVSRIFMGVQIQCAQCHDHPTDRWKRTQFHELAAFFPRIAVKAEKGAAKGKQTFIVYGADRDRAPNKKNNKPRPSAEHYMPDLKNPTAKGTLMQPVFFLTGQKLPEGTPDAERREAIARWITAPQDPWFAKAFVNRIWSELVGEGFYEPVDDIGPDRDCNAPATLDYLAGQFVAHDYDVKWLYRTIMATAAYQRDSRSRHLPGETPFEANCPQRLRADELFDSLMLALGVDGQAVNPRDKAAGGKKKYQPRTPRAGFDFVFGYDPSIRRDDVTGSIPQALILMNSPQLARGINGRNGTALARLLESTKDNPAVVEELYLRTLAREPKADELKTCLEHVKKADNRSEGFEDVLWALINSTEFLHRK
jgi:hypothetical protein